MIVWAVTATIVAVLALVLLFFHASGRGEDLLKIEHLELELAEQTHFAQHWEAECIEQAEIIGHLRSQGVL